MLLNTIRFIHKQRWFTLFQWKKLNEAEPKTKLHMFYNWKKFSVLGESLNSQVSSPLKTKIDIFINYYFNKPSLNSSYIKRNEKNIWIFVVVNLETCLCKLRKPLGYFTLLVILYKNRSFLFKMLVFVLYCAFVNFFFSYFVFFINQYFIVSNFGFFTEIPRFSIN